MVLEKGYEMYGNFYAIIAICVGGLSCHTAEAQRVVYCSGVGIGYASMDRSGNPVITMNRGMCRRNPDLCEFFKSHELGHHQLGHFHRNISVRKRKQIVLLPPTLRLQR